MNNKKIVTGIINCAGIHKRHKQNTIEYGISNGSFWYYCHKCKKFVNKDEIKVNQ
jgi:hypothetical protein